jgi:hypothetical protein
MKRGGTECRQTSPTVRRVPPIVKPATTGRGQRPERREGGAWFGSPVTRLTETIQLVKLTIRLVMR